MNFINDFIQVKVVDPIGIENILGGNSKIINYNPKVYTPTTKTEISAIPNPSREPTILTIGKNHLYADFSLKEQYKRYNSYLEAKKRNVKPKDKFFIHFEGFKSTIVNYVNKKYVHFLDKAPAEDDEIL